jgi:chorismate dehydratase
MAPPSVLRVGVVPYLNMLPMVHGLTDLRLPGNPASRLEVASVPPSRMIRMMESGELDLGMAPVAGVFDHPDWKIVGESMIGSFGAVKSVLMVSMDPPDRWTLLHPDSHSRTSNVLSQVLLWNCFGVRPKLGEPIPPEGWTPPDHPAPGEAFLIIGTRALKWRNLWKDRGGYCVDLGRLWTKWTGLPFVYAVWAARPGAEVNDWMTEFENLKNSNSARLSEIIPKWSGLADEGLTPKEAEEYLTRNIIFNFDHNALRGMTRFHEEGARLGLFRTSWTFSR